MSHHLPDGYTLTPPATDPGVAAPGTSNGWMTYSNPPSEATDAAGRTFRGLLAFKQLTGRLHYIVFLPAEGSRLVWESPPDAGSGSLNASPFQPLRVVWNVLQGKNTPTDSAEVPEFRPHALPVGAGVALPDDSPAWAVYRGPYGPAEFDTPAEIALRVSKLRDGFLALLDAVARRG